MSKQPRNESTEELVRKFAIAGRVFAESQFVGCFACHEKPLNATRKAIRRAEGRGLIATEWVMLHPVLDLASQGTLLDWRPGDSEPNFQRIGYEVRSRWRETPVRTLVAIPTIEGGGTGRLPRPSEVLHDIHVTELGLLFGEAFEHEDRMIVGTREHDFKPDGLLRCEAGEAICLDFAGRYSAEKLAAIHGNYSNANHRYRLY